MIFLIFFFLENEQYEMQEFFSRVFGLLFFHFAANFQILFSWQLRKKKPQIRLGA